MSKQLILITAPFNCGYCDTAKKELPTICEKKGFELIEIQDEKTGKAEEDLPVDMYPTIILRMNEKIVQTIKGYNKKSILNEIKNY